MAYVYFNPNPKQKATGDCVIRGLCKFLNKDWMEIYLEVCLQGALMAELPDSNVVWETVLRNYGFIRETQYQDYDGEYTVNDFCMDHPEGSYILGTGRHVIAVENGNYYDAWDSGNEVPIYYWRKER